MHFFSIFVIFLSVFFTSCAKITSYISTPTYSLHNYGKIEIEKNKKLNNVYIKKSTNDMYNISNRVIKDIENELKKNDVKIVKKVENADYILDFNIKNISTDIDYNFANNLRNSLLIGEANASFEFSSDNSPHIYNNNVKNISSNNDVFFKRKSLSSPTLYTIIGASSGFILGYFLAGAVAPIAIGFGSAILFGGITYYMYSTFRRVGVIITYEVVLKEKINHQINHNRKILYRTSTNSSDEVFYSFKDNWISYNVKDIAISVGSRVLTNDMIENSYKLISQDILKTLNLNTNT